MRTISKKQTKERSIISIIIPYYERPSEILSLLNQLSGVVSYHTGQDANTLGFETIIVNDASKISLPETRYLPPNLGLRIVDNKVNRGPGFSRNRGTAHASGDYIWFLDTDAEIINDRMLANMLTELKSSTSILAVGGMTEEYLGRRIIMRPILLPTFDVIQQGIEYQDAVENGYREKLPLLATTNFFIKSDRFLQSGGFDIELQTHEDNEFCELMVNKIGGYFVQTAGTVVHHSHSNTGRTSGHFNYFSDQKKYTKIRLDVRLVILRRFHRRRLLYLPILEVFSITYTLFKLCRNEIYLIRFRMSRRVGWTTPITLLFLLTKNIFVDALKTYFSPQSGPNRAFFEDS